MRDILSDLETWLASGERPALATVIQTWGSAPRSIGGKMALTPSGKITGSVSGGCVEGAVVQAGPEVLQTGLPQRLHFGVADESAWEVGLACGGQIDVFVQPLDAEAVTRTTKALQSGKRFAVATVVSGPADLLGAWMLVPSSGEPFSRIPDEWSERVEAASLQALGEGRSQLVSLPGAGPEGIDLFVEVVEPQPVLVVVGGAHTAITLTRLAKVIGYRTVVVDPRRAFGNTGRFPHVDQLIQEWPEDAFAQIEVTPETAIVMLTHDPKIDDPAIQAALRSPAFYVGVLGSKSNQAKIRARMAEAGLPEDLIARLHGPIGLKLENATPEEIALSVLTEIVAAKHHVEVREGPAGVRS